MAVKKTKARRSAGGRSLPVRKVKRPKTTQTNIEQFKTLNEELQSSNEELQSLNEELITVNAQLQGRVEEQDALNNDLNNFLASTNIPTVFLDSRFHVKRFTPAISKLIRLMPTDIGRPIIDISREGLGPDLISDAQSVLDNLVSIKKEIMIEGTWYIRTALPYRTPDNRFEGVVITYTDVSELKRAEEHTVHLASFPQLNPNPICEVNSSGQVTFCNPATQKILEDIGIDKENVEVFLPVDLDDILPGLQNKNELYYYREVSIKNKVFAETIALTPRLNFARIYGYDITQRKQAEEALRESEERYRSLIETASEGIWIGDFEGRTTFVNESAAKMIGYSPEELLGRTALDFMDEEARAVARINLEQRRQGHKSSYELKFIRKDGSTLWAIIGATPLSDKNGNVIASMAMLTDITERKKAEEKTLHQQAVLTGINRIFRESLTTDTEEELGRVCLSIAEELTGSEFGFIAEIGQDGLIHDIAISDPGWELCLMADKTGHRRTLAGLKVHGLPGRVIIDEKPFFTNDPYAHHDSIGTPDGHPRLTAFLGVPLVHRGKTIGMVALGNRVGGYRTEDVETVETLATVIVQALMRKRAETSLHTAHTELRQRAYELEAVNRELEAFSYIVSHDLKAPLRSIDGFTRALLEDYTDKLDATGKDYLERVKSATLRMNQLIEAMLNMARLTRGELNEKTVDLSFLVHVVVHDLQKQDSERGVEFVLAEKVKTKGDQDMLLIVLQNLLDNAWKFTSKHSRAKIEFGTTDMYGRTVFFVRDDGAGFDMQFADKLFMPFKRLHTESEFPGLGIGLAIANRIILRHNGRLWAESAPEKGATFYFTLP